MNFNTYTVKQKYVLEWIIKHTFLGIDESTKTHNVTLFQNLITKWIDKSGRVWTIRRLKAMRNLVTRYMVGQPLLVNHDMISTVDGFPKPILFLKEFIDSGESEKIRFVMTLLTYSRSIECHGKPKLDSITDPFKGEIKTIDSDFINQFVRDFNVNTDTPKMSWKDLFFVFKGGIYGKQLITSIESLNDWTDSLWKSSHVLAGSFSHEIKTLLRLNYVLKFVEDFAQGRG
jgi:hypothetical protein